MNPPEPPSPPSNAPQAPSTRRRLLVLSFAVLLVLAGGVIALLVRTGDEAASRPRTGGGPSFDSQKWLKADPEDGTREEMVEELLQHHLKPGMTLQETVKLLGRPGPGDKYPCLQPLPDKAVDSLCYTVSLGLDPCTLLLGFDSAGRLIHSAKDCS